MKFIILHTGIYCFRGSGLQHLSSRARNTQVWAITMFSLVQEIAVSAPIRSVEISSQGLKTKVVELNYLREPTITPHTITSSMALHTHTYTYFCNAYFIASSSSASAWGLESRTRGFKAQSSQFLCAHTERNVEGMAQK